MIGASIAKQPLLTQIAWLKKGEEKDGNRPGKNLNHLFRFDLAEDLTDEDTKLITEQFTTAYGSFTPDHVKFVFPFRTISDNWEAYYQAFRSNQSVAGEIAFLPEDPAGELGYFYKTRWNFETKNYDILHWKHVDTGEEVKGDPLSPIKYIPEGTTKAGKPKKPVTLKYKAYGYLKMLIGGLDVWGITVLRTTALADIGFISGDLLTFWQSVSNTEAGLRRIPLQLIRKKGSKRKPGTNIKTDEYYVRVMVQSKFVGQIREQHLMIASNTTSSTETTPSFEENLDGEIPALEAGEEIKEGEILETEPMDMGLENAPKVPVPEVSKPRDIEEKGYTPGEVPKNKDDWRVFYEYAKRVGLFDEAMDAAQDHPGQAKQAFLAFVKEHKLKGAEEK